MNKTSKQITKNISHDRAGINDPDYDSFRNNTSHQMDQEKEISA